MENKISKKKIMKMLNSGFSDLSVDDIKYFIRSELEKDESEIDTDYVDMLFRLLAIKQNGHSEKKKTYYKKTLKVLVAAAVIIVFFASALTVSANVFNFNIPQKIAQLFSGKAEIDFDLENADITADGYALTETDLAKKLAEFGISPVTFPEEMINDNCEITKIENRTVDEAIAIDVLIDFEYQGNYGKLSIIQYALDFGWDGIDDSMDVISGQMINVNGMDVLIFERDDSCSIRYKDNLIRYDIYLECDINNVIQFAESLK